MIFGLTRHEWHNKIIAKHLEVKLRAAPVTALVVPLDSAAGHETGERGNTAVLFGGLGQLDLSLKGFVAGHWLDTPWWWNNIECVGA